MVIREYEFLSARNCFIHEAAHFLVAKRFNIPVMEPEVFNNAPGGRVRLLLDIEKVGENHPIVANISDEDIPEDVKSNFYLQLCSMYLAGFAAEAIYSNTNTDNIIGNGRWDVIAAEQLLAQYNLNPSLLEKAWIASVSILRNMWPDVVEKANSIEPTDLCFYEDDEEPVSRAPDEISLPRFTEDEKSFLQSMRSPYGEKIRNFSDSQCKTMRPSDAALT